MKKRRKETKYISVLTVRIGTISSLIDMMRYDRCCPATEEDSGKLERLVGFRGEPNDHIVTLLRFATRNDPPSDRWRSFNCVVLDERSPEEPPFTIGEALAAAGMVHQ